VGAEHKGPLAAFVVIAVIAGVLLVTSVRSQAAPGWLIPDEIPAAVVAGPLLSLASGDPGESSDGVPASHDGSGSVHQAHSATGSTAATLPAVHTVVHSSIQPAVHGRARATHHPAYHHPSRHHGPATVLHPDPAPAPARHDHGRHLGWSHGKGHGHSGDLGRGHGRGLENRRAHGPAQAPGHGPH
jgi:hypothetical protein